jgi:hypothetical protein
MIVWQALVVRRSALNPMLAHPTASNPAISLGAIHWTEPVILLEELLSGIVATILLSVCVWLIQRFRRQVKERNRAELELYHTRDALEARVRLRTSNS